MSSMSDPIGTPTRAYDRPPSSAFIAQGRTKGIIKGREEGYASGQAESLICGLFIVLAARELHLSAKTYNRIADCTDLDELEFWLRRAATADSVGELFA